MHIVGCPRSGTTLMMEIMTTCFECDGHCEHEASIFLEPDGQPNLYFSKQPRDILHLKRIFLLDPNLFVIYMVRDPRAVITSIHSSNPGIYFCNFPVWKECHDAARELIDHPRFLSVQYEQLTAEPDRIQNMISGRFPFLVKKHDFSSFEHYANPSDQSTQAMSGLRPMTTERHRSWEKHLPRLKAEYQKHSDLADVLIECGYEQDQAWTMDLHGVEARDFECRYGKKVFNLKKHETRLRKYLQSRAYIARHRLT